MKKAIFIIALFLGLFSFQSALGAIDSFDTYDVGELNGQGDWDADFTGCPACVSPLVATGTFITLPSQPNWLNVRTHSLTAEAIDPESYFQISFQAYGGFGNTVVDFQWATGTKSSDQVAYNHSFDSSTGVCKWAGYTIDCSIWHELGQTIAIDAVTNVVTEYISIDGVDYMSTTSYAFTPTFFRIFALDWAPSLAIDNLSMWSGTNPGNELYPGKMPSSYGDTSFETIYPVDGRRNLVSYTTSSIYFNAVGFFHNASCASYDDISIILTDSDGWATTVDLGVTAEAPEGCSSTTYGNSAFYSKSIILPKNNYRVEYKATGIDPAGLYTVFTHYISGTGVFWTDTGEAVDFWGTRSYTACQTYYDNCIASSTSFLDRAVCGVQGAFWSLFCPDPATLEKSLAIVDSAKTRFPVNVPIELYGILNGYGTSTQEETGTTTLVDSDFSLVANSIGDWKDWALFALIRQILSWVIIFVFFIYIINFARKTFFTK